ncbi:hypothetical protein K0U07_01710 [bacterium]|nr:hypothetical protein [bacterium]
MKGFWVAVFVGILSQGYAYTDLQYKEEQSYLQTSSTNGFNYMSVGGFTGIQHMGIVSFGHRKKWNKIAFDLSGGTGASLSIRQVNLSGALLQYFYDETWYFGLSCDVYFAAYHKKELETIIFPCPNILVGKEFEKVFHQLKATWFGASYSFGIKF